MKCHQPAPVVQKSSRTGEIDTSEGAERVEATAPLLFAASLTQPTFIEI